MENIDPKTTEYLNDYFFQQLAEHPLPPYYVLTWSRDCDMAESSNIRVHEDYISLVRSYVGFRQSLEDAEGPSYWQIVDPVPDDVLGEHTRDRVMEAFENGRGTSTYV